MTVYVGHIIFIHRITTGVRQIINSVGIIMAAIMADIFTGNLLAFSWAIGQLSVTGQKTKS